MVEKLLNLQKKKSFSNISLADIFNLNLVFFLIGRRIAELEIDTFVGKIIENFQVEWFGEPIRSRASTLNYLIGPYNFIFKDI